MAFTLRSFVCSAALGVTVAACASAPRPAPPVYAPSMTPADEAAAIERAKHSPIAQPRERPLYPEQSPPPLTADEKPTISPYAKRFADVSKAARTELDSQDLGFRDSYAQPGYGYAIDPAYGWGVGVGLWPSYYGWRRPFGYWNTWPHRYWGIGPSVSYHGDYRLRAPFSGGGWNHGGHFGLGGGRGHGHR